MINGLMIGKAGFEEFFNLTPAPGFRGGRQRAGQGLAVVLKGQRKYEKITMAPHGGTHIMNLLMQKYCMSNKNGANSGICVNIYVYIECKTCSWLTLGIPIHYQTANDDL